MLPPIATLSTQDMSRGTSCSTEWGPSTTPRLLEVLQMLNEALDAALGEEFEAVCDAAS